MGTIFHLMCPDQTNDFHRVVMARDGTVRGKYKDYCPHTREVAEPKKREISIAYNNNYWGGFYVYGAMVMKEDFPLHNTLVHAKEYPIVTYDWEIFKMFFENYNIEPKWIYCYNIPGLFDEETGKWTGAVGKV